MKCVNGAVCAECLDLLKTVQEKIQTTADNDIIYNESITIENNMTYMKHR